MWGCLPCHRECFNTDSVYTVNFGGGFESQLHFPQCYYHPYPKKGFKIHHTLLECRLYAQLRVHEFYWNGILNSHTVAQPQVWVLQARGRPCSENPVWSPVQWWSKEIFFELRSERGMLGGRRQLQMRGTAILVHLNLSTIERWVEMLPGISLVD